MRECLSQVHLRPLCERRGRGQQRRGDGQPHAREEAQLKRGRGLAKNGEGEKLFKLLKLLKLLKLFKLLGFFFNR